MKISSESNPKNIYTNAGNYIIDLTAHNGLKSDTKTLTITVVP
jgi:PKD repeat protein